MLLIKGFINKIDVLKKFSIAIMTVKIDELLKQLMLTLTSLKKSEITENKKSG